jgi:16S rRNA (uracil1498-N3)-methyltransferase
MELYYQPEITKGKHFLDSDESRHCIKVLRHSVGDIIQVTDGKGVVFNCALTSENPKQCTFSIASEIETPKKSYTIAIAIAPTKSMDRTEWFVEKSVEIGIDTIHFYFGQHSERRNLKLDRLKKKAVAAMKQSGQARLPELILNKNLAICMKNFDTFDEHFIAYVDNENPDQLMRMATKGKKQIVLIGPEGDFSTSELANAQDNGYKKVSLGKNRLRTERPG